MTTKERFIERTQPDGDCIVWLGHINRSGYGSVWHEGKNRDAHRVSYELHVGPIPDGAHIMHKCDNRRCVNPLHLRAGTRHENMMDMFIKGRARRVSGVVHHNAKLCPEIVAEIRRRYTPYHRVNGSMAMAREFGVTQSAVYSALRGNTWAAKAAAWRVSTFPAP